MWEVLASIEIALTGVKGVNYMLKIISKPLLNEISKRMIITVPTEGHFVRQAEPDKPISFWIDFIRPSTLPIRGY